MLTKESWLDYAALKAIKALLREQKEKGNIIICLEFQHAKTMSDDAKGLLDPGLSRVFSF